MSNTNNTRHLTVLRKGQPRQKGKHYITHPDLRLSGLWMAQTGFRSGQRVAVECFNRKLIITPISEPEEYTRHK